MEMIKVLKFIYKYCVFQKLCQSANYEIIFNNFAGSMSRPRRRHDGDPDRNVAHFRILHIGLTSLRTYACSSNVK